MWCCDPCKILGLHLESQECFSEEVTVALTEKSGNLPEGRAPEEERV